MLPRSHAGLAGALLHLALLGYAVAQILSTGGPDWPKHWFIFLAFDFPVSLGVIPVTWLVPPASAGPLSDFANFWWPLAYHGVVGTAWWYIAGWAIARRIERAQAARTRERQDP
jgi:hypothetical protein